MRFLPHILLGVMLVLAARGCSTPPMRDAEMLKLFRTHRVELEQLRDLAIKDAPLHCRRGVWPDDDLKQQVGGARFKEYSKLMNTTGTRFIYSGRDSVHYSVFIEPGSPTQGYWPAKGFVYTNRPISSTVESLDHIQCREYYPGPFHRRIDEHWYLFLEFSMSKRCGPG